MALVKLSDYGDIEDGLCVALEALTADTNIVVSDDPNDYFVASPCQLGNEIIQNGGENSNVDYLIPVIDGVTNCLGWKTKPADPVYDSTLLAPWAGGSVGEASCHSSAPGVLETYWRAVAQLAVPTFAVDVKLMVRWTALWHGPDAFDYALWYPHFGSEVVYPGVGNAVGFANERLEPSANWRSGAYTMFLDLPAYTTGKYLGVMFNGTIGTAHGRVAAWAFKA